MLNLEDLKDKLTETFNKIKDAVEESSAYNSLREKYDTLPATTQRGILIGAAVVAALILLSIPYSFLSSSGQYVGEFEEHRALIRALLRTRSLGGGPPLPRGLSSNEIETRVKMTLNQASLLDTQIDKMEGLSEGEPQSHLAPPNVLQQGLRVKLKKLNLRQVLDLGHQLQNLDESLKMTGVEIKASSDDAHYFDTIFTLISYSLPESVEKSEKEGSRPRGKKGAR